MQIPKLLFHHHDDDEKVVEVHPDKNHVYEGDFDDYQISNDQQPSPDEDDFTSVLGNPWSEPGPVRRSSEDIPNLKSVNEEIDRNICSISDIYGNGEAGENRDSFGPIGSIGRLPDYDDQPADDYNLCSISALQDNDQADDVFSSDYIARLSPRRKDNQMPDDILPSIADLQVFDYEVNKDDKGVVAESPRKSSEMNTFPLELQGPEEEDGEGLWFGSHPNEQDTTVDDRTKQCDKILTFDTEFALPIICQPFIEKDRQNRSFGERDFQRHRKEASLAAPAGIFAPGSKKSHKPHKHKHSSRKEKQDAKASKENQSQLKLKDDKKNKRPRSATFNNATAILAMMPLQEISEKQVDTGAMDKEATNKLKRSKSLSLDETDELKRKEAGGDKSRKHRHHRNHHQRHHHARHLKNKGLNAQDTLESRIRSGMHALEEERKALREIVDEIDTFGEKDRDDITSHRFGHLQHHSRAFDSANLRPHRHHRSGMLTHLSDMDTVSVCSFRPQKPHMQITMDDDVPRGHQETGPKAQQQLSPINASTKDSGFVELEELTATENNGLQWKERARWIKFEEDVEKNERWGKPHVASLSFQSLLELRKGLETGTVLLNLDNYDLPTIFESIVENLVITDQIHSTMREKVKGILLSKHCHHHQNKPGLLRRKPSTVSLTSQGTRDSGFASDANGGGSNGAIGDEIEMEKVDDPLMSNCNGHTTVDIADDWSSHDGDEFNKKKSTVKFAPITEEPFGPSDPKTESDVKERIPEGAEATSVLVAAIEDLDRTAVAFVRLAKGCLLGNLTEVSIPVRFLFVIMGPPSNHDYFEIGRSVATLMSDKIFHDLAYSAKNRDDILAAINSFLDDSIVLAPGDWDRHLLLPLLQAEISEKRRERIKLLKQQAQWEDPDEDNPLERTGKFFGGLKREIPKKMKFFKSDILDGFNVRCLVSIIFVFFATFAPTITFGALLEKKTKGNLGVIETLLATSFSGIFFGLFSGQPLMIVGTTGPILVFEEATFNLSYLFGIDFLKWRLWIGVWVMIICWAVVMFEGCFLVEHFTRFTEEVFSVLISLLFVYEAIYFLIKTFKENPLMDYDKLKGGVTLASNFTLNSNITNITSPVDPTSSPCSYRDPNVALISTLLLLGTFYIAYYLRMLRVSHFLSSKARRVLSDFGVPFAMVFMVVLNIIAHDVSHVPKLKFKKGIQPTRDDRQNFYVSPFGLNGYWIIAAFLPALCVSILLFMETELTGVVLNKRKNKLKKGGGYNMDLAVMGLICGLCSITGLPWMCAATVRAVQHQNALAVMSRSHAPGERPYLLRIHEQRLTNICIHILIGICVVAYPLIEEIPLAVCYGVFFYLGFTSLSGIQFIEQLKLIFVPSKYHPNRKYIRNVTYRSLLWYTMIQVFCLLLLIICKLSPAAPAFPFIIIGMVFLRRFIERYFTEDELEDLDNEDDGDFDEYDEYGGILPC